MKKRVLAILMTMCMVAGLSACGNKGHKFAEITIEGEKYNLSKDFEEVVKGLVKNDVQVISYVNSSLLEPNGYNEECKLEKAEEYEIHICMLIMLRSPDFILSQMQRMLMIL